MSPIYIYSLLSEQPPILYTPLTGLGQWHEQRRTTHSYSYNLSWSCTTSLASSCNWSCNQVYSHNKSCQWSGEVVQLSYDRRILRSATTMKDHQGFVPRPSHDRRTTVARQLTTRLRQDATTSVAARLLHMINNLSATDFGRANIQD